MGSETKLGMIQEGNLPKKDPFSDMHGGVWDVFPMHRADLWRIKEILLEIRSGAAEAEKLYDYLDENPEIDTLVSVDAPALGHSMNALIALRKEIEFEAEHPKLAQTPNFETGEVELDESPIEVAA